MIDFTNFTLTSEDFAWVGVFLFVGGWLILCVVIPVVAVLERLRNRKYDREYGLISCITFSSSLLGAIILSWTAFSQGSIFFDFIATILTCLMIIMLGQAWNMALGKNEKDSEEE